jgi:hypothetical protein
METVRGMLQEFEDAAWSIAEAGLDEQPWTQLRGRVIELIQRGNRTVTLIERTYSDDWMAICWDETDTPVMLARAFGTVHRRLAGAARTRVGLGDELPLAGNSAPWTLRVPGEAGPADLRRAVAV